MPLVEGQQNLRTARTSTSDDRSVVYPATEYTRFDESSERSKTLIELETYNRAKADECLGNCRHGSSGLDP